MSTKRRGHGEGSIYKRADGRWEGRLSLPGGRRKAYYGKTRGEVARKLTAALKTTQDGLPLIGERQTTRQYLERWLESVKPSLRPSTHKSYCDIARCHLIPALGHIPLAKLGPQHIQQMLAAKRQTGLSPRRVQYIRAVLRRALGQALRWGLVARNVATLVDPPRQERYEIKPLSPDQVATLLEAARGDRHAALYTLAIATGLRQGELLALRWTDLDEGRQSLTVGATLQKVDREFRLLEPKTARSRRAIDLPAIAVAALRQHRASQLEERLRLGAAWQDWGLVFATEQGTPLDASSITHRFQKLLNRAGLPRIRFHDLRHTCASLLLAQGVPPRMIMEVLGHSQISLTMNTYAHILPALRQQAAEAMDAALGGAKGQ